MALQVTTTGSGALEAKLRRLATADFMPLMQEWEVVIAKDNLRGVLAGQTKDDTAMKRVTYRPKGARATTQRQRNRGGGTFGGLGPHAAGLHNNLTSAEYRRLAGPPLAPRGTSSRVITNLLTMSGRDGDQWFALGYWDEVVDTKGRLFLPRAFRQGRDLRGVRREGVNEATSLLRLFVAGLFRG